jgi:hypothetical protein
MNRRGCSHHTLLVTATVGALTVGGLVSAPAANATCASFFGLGNSAQCSSNLTSIAIAIGSNATAKATGLFGAAFAVGTNSIARTDGALSFATAVGDGSLARTYDGPLSVALAGGVNSDARAGGATPYAPASVANVAVALCNKDCGAEARGIANIAVNLLGNNSSAGLEGSANVVLDVAGTGSFTTAYGSFNNAVSVAGNNSYTSASSATVAVLSTAFTIGSRGTGPNLQRVQAGPGPFALAGSVFQTDAIVTKSGPGFNINGVKAGGVAATRKHAPQSASASTGATSGTPKKGASRSSARSTGSTDR